MTTYADESIRPGILNIQSFVPDVLKDRAALLDQLYHSETYEELVMKMAIRNISELTFSDLCWLADVEVYHCAYWGTKGRWNAFQKLLDRDQQCQIVIKSSEFIRFCDNNITAIIGKDNALKNVTPGSTLELKLWKKLKQKCLKLKQEKRQKGIIQR